MGVLGYAAGASWALWLSVRLRRAVRSGQPPSAAPSRFRLRRRGRRPICCTSPSTTTDVTDDDSALMGLNLQLARREFRVERHGGVASGFAEIWPSELRRRRRGSRLATDAGVLCRQFADAVVDPRIGSRALPSLRYPSHRAHARLASINCGFVTQAVIACESLAPVSPWHPNDADRYRPLQALQSPRVRASCSGSQLQASDRLRRGSRRLGLGHLELGPRQCRPTRRTTADSGLTLAVDVSPGLRPRRRSRKPCDAHAADPVTPDLGHDVDRTSMRSASRPRARPQEPRKHDRLAPDLRLCGEQLQAASRPMFARGRCPGGPRRFQGRHELAQTHFVPAARPLQAPAPTHRPHPRSSVATMVTVRVSEDSSKSRSPSKKRVECGC